MFFGKDRDDLTQDEIRFLKSLSDARYGNWTQWKESNYDVKTKTDSTGFVTDILIRRSGTSGGSEHIHIYTDSVSGRQGTHLKIVKDGQTTYSPLDDYRSVGDLIDEFCD